MVTFNFRVENQTETNHTLTLVNITPPKAQYNPQPAQTIDDGTDNKFAISDPGVQLTSTLRYRLNDGNGHQVGTYDFTFTFNGQFSYQQTLSPGLDVFIDVQDNGANSFEIDITCQLA